MKELKLLFVGNSFALDTIQHAPEIAHALGVERVHFGLLYVGGCSIDMHYGHAVLDLPAYTYHTNTGDGWTQKKHVRISEALARDEWDWIAIQHGTKGTSRYTSPECYERLTPLVQYLKERASAHCKIAFNLTWLGESTRQHHEILSYHGDMRLMREKLIEVTRETVLTNPLVDLLVPTGTAIENARTSKIGLLTRDCYHLSVDKGRYIAGLTFVSTITGLAPDGITWAPEGVDDYARRIAIEAAKNAIAAPLQITPSKF